LFTITYDCNFPHINSNMSKKHAQPQRTAAAFYAALVTLRAWSD
jgi:hypothetical protein